MARTRLLNGKRIALTPAEEAQRDAEDLAFVTAPVVPPRLSVLDRLLDALGTKGVLTTADLDAVRGPKP